MGDCATRGQAKTKLAYAGTVTNTSEYVTKDEVIAWGGNSSYLNKYISGNELVALEDIVKGGSKNKYIFTIVSTVEQVVKGLTIESSINVNNVKTYDSVLGFTKLLDNRHYNTEVDFPFAEDFPNVNQQITISKFKNYGSLGSNIFIDKFGIVAIPVDGGTRTTLLDKDVKQWSNDISANKPIQGLIESKYINDTINFIFTTYRLFEEVNNGDVLNDSMIEFQFSLSNVPNVTSLRVSIGLSLKEVNGVDEVGSVLLKGDLPVSSNRVNYKHLLPFILTGNLPSGNSLVSIESISVMGTPTADGSGAGVGYDLGLISLIFGYMGVEGPTPIREINLGGILSSEIGERNINFSIQNTFLKSLYLGFNVGEVQIN